jgi:hypothetical protein
MSLYRAIVVPDDSYAVIRKGKVITLPIEEKKMIAKMIPPHMDKHWSFQAVNVTEEQVKEVRAAFHAPQVKQAEPFLQGNNGGWLMVEFWTNNPTAVLNAGKYLFDLFELSYAEGQFTRKELGLE